MRMKKKSSFRNGYGADGGEIHHLKKTYFSPSPSLSAMHGRVPINIIIIIILTLRLAYAPIVPHVHDTSIRPIVC